MAETAPATTTGYEPIRWVGWSWYPERVVRFEDADGRQFEISAQAALDAGAFEWSTTTRERRDALLAWASDPAMACPPALPEGA